MPQIFQEVGGGMKWCAHGHCECFDNEINVKRQTYSDLGYV